MDAFFTQYNNNPIIFVSQNGNKFTFTWVYAKFTVEASDKYEAYRKAYNFLLKNRY